MPVHKSSVLAGHSACRSCMRVISAVFQIYIVLFSFNPPPALVRHLLLPCLNENNNVYLSDPQTHSSFLYTRCRPMHSRCGAAHADTVVWPAAAAADAVLGKMLIKN